MRIEDEACRARGFVSPSFVDVRTGVREPFSIRHNTLSFMSAEAMAAAFGGDPSYIPARIGFIYGDKEMMPTESAPTRSQSWDMLVEELGSDGNRSDVDVQVVCFSYPPTLGGEKPVPCPGCDSSSSGTDSSGSDSGHEDDYCNILPTGSNAITFHAVSNSSDRGAIFGRAAFAATNFVYQAVLLGYHPNYAGTPTYYVISRVSLKDEINGDPKYLRKPSGFEVALDWTVVFR